MAGHQQLLDDYSYANTLLAPPGSRPRTRGHVYCGLRASRKNVCGKYTALMATMTICLLHCTSAFSPALIKNSGMLPSFTARGFRGSSLLPLPRLPTFSHAPSALRQDQRLPKKYEGLHVLLTQDDALTESFATVMRTLLRVQMSVLKKFLRFLWRIDVQLVVYFGLWYMGNYYHNITGKIALNMTGGAMGCPVTIATMQMGIGCLYALFLWAAPDARKFPAINMRHVIKMIPVAFCNAGVHGFSSFATSAGAVSFGQMVKAAEPVFAAVLGTTVYGKRVSTARWLCLVPIIGGVVLASVSELNFAWLAFWAASIANVFAAFKGNENAKLMASGEIADKLETVGNQFAVTTLCSFLILLPVMIILEGSKWGYFVNMLKTSPILATNFVLSGLLLYGYNECATMTIKKTSAMTQSVANTAKRAVVIVGSALVFGESLSVVKLAGCAIALCGVLLYSVIDTLLHKAARFKQEFAESSTFQLLEKQPADCIEALRCMATCVGAACEECKDAMCAV